MLGKPEGVSIVNAADNSLIAAIAIENKGFNDVAISRDSTRAYTTGTKNQVSVIDVAAHTLLTRIDVGKEPIGIAITPDGKLA
jgi:YVTN family beta-propeller protein